MTDNRILMTTIKITGALALSLVLTACSNNPLMRSATATSTDAADAIDQSLEEATQPEPAAPASTEASAPLPADVSAALLPSLSGGADLDERFDVNARGVPAASFFESLVEGTRYNVVVHPDVTTSIDLRLGDVTVPEVMDIAGDLYGLDIRRNGRLFRVQADQVQTRMFPIDYLHFKRKGGSETRVSSGQVTGARSGSSGNSNSNGDSTGSGETRNLVGTTISTETASDFWKDIQSALSMIVGGGDGQQVIVNPGAGLVMVRAGSEDLRMVEEYLRRTELIMQRQVILEAKIRAFRRMREMHQTLQSQRDVIAGQHAGLLRDQQLAKIVFDRVAHAGALNDSCLRYLQSAYAMFNGDILLAAHRPSGELHLLLGDFTGHGLSAAIGAMPLAEVFYAMTAKGFALRDILLELNCKLGRILPVGIFCCAVLIELNAAKGLVEVWNGGLPEVLVLGRDGALLQRVPSSNLPLGVANRERFNPEPTVMAMQPGERLL